MFDIRHVGFQSQVEAFYKYREIQLDGGIILFWMVISKQRDVFLPKVNNICDVLPLIEAHKRTDLTVKPR